ncbi:DUF2723 domain-containing protein [candidate division KSB1 bacterium]|nr:DUF2723 domain-containing protein [candidate division KSB1 bacterium]
MKKYKQLIYVFAIVVVFGVLYLLTMPPTVLSGDSARFQILANKLGIAHPSGYPLYTSISFLFTRIIISNPAYTVNLFSAVFGIIFLVVLFKLVDYLFENKTVSLLAVFIMGLSQIFWYQSIRAEVYTFYLTLLTISLFCLLSFFSTGKNSWFYWSMFVLGLYTSSRLMMVPIVAVFVVLVFFKYKKQKKMLILFFTGLLCFAVPFLLNLVYVLMIDKNNIGYNYISLYNAEFNILPGNDTWAGLFRRAKWILLVEQYGGIINLNISDMTTAFLILVKSVLKVNFSLPAIFLALYGMWVAYHRDKFYFFLFASPFAVNMGYFLTTLAGDRLTNVLPAYLTICVFFGFGLDGIIKLYPSNRKYIYAILCLLFTYLAFTNYKSVDRSHLYGHQEHAIKVLDQTPENGVMFVSWPFSTTLLYQRMVLLQRTDLKIVPIHESTIDEYMLRHPEGDFYIVNEEDFTVERMYQFKPNP